MARRRIDSRARQSAGIAVVFLALTAWNVILADSDADSIPGRLHVEVIDTEGRGWGPLLERLREEIVLELRSADCLDLDVEHRPPDADVEALLLSVGIGDVVEESDYSIGLADRYDDQRSPASEAESLTARLRAEIVFQLLVLPERLVVRTRQARPQVRREGAIGTDARDEARAAMREQIAQRSRKLICKGGDAALRRDLGRARSAR